MREVHLYASYLEKLLSVDKNNNNSTSTLSTSVWINNVPLVKVPATFWPNWHAGAELMEIYDTEGKGRGVRATTDLPAGQVLLVERALIRHTWDGGKNYPDATDSTTPLKESQLLFRHQVVQRSQSDAIFTTICHQLYNGVNSDLTPSANATTFDGLLLDLEHHHYGTLLLPSHVAYLFHATAETSLPLDDRRAAGMIQYNAHRFHLGQREKDVHTNQGIILELYPALDMFNHDAMPNCKYCKLSKPGAQEFAVCMTTRTVTAGEELTISYGPNQELIRQNFGF